MMEKDEESSKIPLSEENIDIEEHFPANKLEIISHSLANTDSKTICDKIIQY